MHLVLVNERQEVISLIVRIKSEGLPLPAAVLSVSAQEMVETGHKGPWSFAKMHRVEEQA